MRFRILPKVTVFGDAQGVDHYPGEVVDLPSSYLGESWLEPIEEPKKVQVPPANVEKISEPSEEKRIPLEKPKRSPRKKLES